MPTDVFISYTRGDLEVTASIVRALEELGLSIWWDSRLLPGDDIDTQIHQVLAEARIVVAVLSPSSIASDWVLWELSQARRNGLTIMPILVRGAQPQDLPPSLDSIEALAWPSESGRTPLSAIGTRVRDLVESIKLRPVRSSQGTSDPGTRDARRRLAAAAAETARRGPEAIAGGCGADPATAVDPAPYRRDRVSPASYMMSEGLIAFLGRHDLAIAFTSPQSGSLYMLGRDPDGGLMVHQESFSQAMGLDRAGDTLLLATLTHIYSLENNLENGQRVEDTFTHRYLPRVGHSVGALDVHDIGMNGEGDVVFVNTRWNCLTTVSKRHNLKPIWVPSFISEIADGDRCHLNGLAMRDGAPAYVTAAARADSVDGWRDQRSGGGIVMDVESNAIVCEGLSMPHSPRLHDDRLWLLNSGFGELGFVEGAETGGGQFLPIASCPGYARGLAFHGEHAFVGLSRPRYADFAGLELEHRFEDALSESWCGIQIIETGTGKCVEWFRIDRQIGEIYGVAVLPNVLCPRSVRPMKEESLESIKKGAKARQSTL